ncbi:MAG: hypothetical protein A2X59_07905 [Nitrospirae bacterium GWC2_42_7]|nr:MAG: hypothetical protein A2X59_07905 [Nitrospirae bacterium GWC2_42_7]
MDKIKLNLTETVRYLAEEIGQRSYRDLGQLNRTADFIEGRFLSYGCAVKRQEYNCSGNTYYNIIAEVKPASETAEYLKISPPLRGGKCNDEGILVIGAHYDTVIGTKGADDNASGIAGLLELARLTSLKPLKRTVRFVAFTLEEPPFFMTQNMGSYVYAKSLKEEGTKVYGMIALEMLGYYCDQKGCQYYPASFLKLLYPDKGNFIVFVGNISSKSFTSTVEKYFKAVSSFPARSFSGVSFIPGVDFSDHRNFWKFDFPAFMVTDTAFYRNPNYHEVSDTADTLDYDKMAEVVEGLFKALGDI